MKNYVLISAYFGKFPRHFNLWLKSAEQNRNIDFYIYGDCNTDNLTVPENVKFIHISFDEMKSRIQNKFDFEIVLDAYTSDNILLIPSSISFCVNLYFSIL